MKPQDSRLRQAALALSLFALALAAGCVTSRTIQKQVERVAKDWCLVIRASQVIPIYPLTEDLVPGDVFIVQQTREEQVRLYHDAGFLPLDHHFIRLRPDNYTNFYLGAHGVGNGRFVPYTWTLPDATKPDTNQIAAMPKAAFPTYSFEVKRAGGFNLALPIQGVPVALSFLNSSSARGSVVLRNANTYGVDESSLADLVYNWAALNTNILADLAPAKGRTNYLRVINRVYLVRAVSFSLTRDSATGVGGSAGADKDVNLTSLQTTNAAANFAATVSNLNASVASAAMPGGSFKFTGASSRSVSMDEEFARPLVVGYLGFDIPILTNGQVGPLTSTLRILSGNAPAAPAKAVKWRPDPNTELIRNFLQADAANRAKLEQWLARHNYAFGTVTTYFESRADFKALREKFVAEVLRPQP